MELLLISENKIKISLTKEDLDGYSITADDIDYDNTETRRVFWTLLDEAKRKTGFDAAKNRIFIQIYPGKDGGCELYVSKLTRPERETDSSHDIFRTSVKRNVTDKKVNDAVYCFEEISGLISVCKRLKAIGYFQKVSAYSDGEKRFFLSLDSPEKEFPFIMEYAEAQDSRCARLYINEHCSLICDGDAVERLGNL